MTRTYQSHLFVALLVSLCYTSVLCQRNREKKLDELKQGTLLDENAAKAASSREEFLNSNDHVKIDASAVDDVLPDNDNDEVFWHLRCQACRAVVNAIKSSAAHQVSIDGADSMTEPVLNNIIMEVCQWAPLNLGVTLIKNKTIEEQLKAEYTLATPDGPKVVGGSAYTHHLKTACDNVMEQADEVVFSKWMYGLKTIQRLICNDATKMCTRADAFKKKLKKDSKKQDGRRAKSDL